MLDDLITVMSKTIDITGKVIKPETRFAEDLGADYLDLAEIAMEIEDKYNIDILNDRTVIYSKTIADLLRAVEKRVQENK